MIKLEIKNGKKKNIVLIDDNFQISSDDEFSKKIAKKVIEDSNLDTTGSSGALEFQVIDFLKTDKIYKGFVRVLDFKPVYYPYDYEVNWQKYKDNKNT